MSFLHAAISFPIMCFEIPLKYPRFYATDHSWSVSKALITYSKAYTDSLAGRGTENLQQHVKLPLVKFGEVTFNNRKFTCTHCIGHTEIPQLNEICRQQLGDFDIRLNTIIQLVVSLLPMLPLVRQFSFLEVKQPQPKHLKMILFQFLLASIKEMTT